MGMILERCFPLIIRREILYNLWSLPGRTEENGVNQSTYAKWAGACPGNHNFRAAAGRVKTHRTCPTQYPSRSQFQYKQRIECSSEAYFSLLVLVSGCPPLSISMIAVSNRPGIYVSAVIVGLRGLTMNGINHNFSRWVNAEGILGKKFYAMKDGNLVERDVKTCSSILNLTP